MLAARPAGVAAAMASASAAAAAANPEPPPTPPLPPRRRHDLASAAAPAMLPSSRPGVALRDEIEELEEDTASSAANP